MVYQRLCSRPKSWYRYNYWGIWNIYCLLYLLHLSHSVILVGHWLFIELPEGRRLRCHRVNEAIRRADSQCVCWRPEGSWRWNSGNHNEGEMCHKPQRKRCFKFHGMCSVILEFLFPHQKSSFWLLVDCSPHSCKREDALSLNFLDIRIWACSLTLTLVV